MTFTTNIADRVKRSYRSLRGTRKSIVPVRPIVMLQSDDWGRVGIPQANTLERLASDRADVGHSQWDYYGLESEGDLIALKDVLDGVRDHDGISPCITANFIMANADLARMRDEDLAQFRWIPIDRGFPSPWKDELLPIYRELAVSGVFEPALHGFTHFNPTALMQCLWEKSERGRRARLLIENDVPYLASLTPEYNFALVTRGRREQFLDAVAQDEWIASGVRLFVDAFGIVPRAACAPGYRANATTRRLWKEHGIEAFQSVGPDGLGESDGLVELQRNVHFEPVLEDGDIVARALYQAKDAVARGAPIVICTHSINYVTRFVGEAERSRELLRKLLTSLLDVLPDLRFSRAAEVIDARKNMRADWFGLTSQAGQATL